MQKLLRTLMATACLAACMPALAASDSVARTYPSGLRVAANLGNDLYETLDPKYQRLLKSNPVEAENMAAPVITPVAAREGNSMWGGVSISAGYIDLVNHLAHAKAIDRIQPGYFQQYVMNLARQTGSNSPPEAPNIVDNRYWTDALMNEQAGYFNQMMGMTLAVNMSHHYLGHYNQYASLMMAGKLVPINNLIAPESWQASVKAASLNCLNCALGLDGAKALFEAIDQMPSRPGWTACFVPPNTDLKKLAAQLTRYEDSYFHGRLN